MAPVDRVANLPVTDVQSTSVELIAKSSHTVKFTQIFHNKKAGKLLKFKFFLNRVFINLFLCFLLQAISNCMQCSVIQYPYFFISEMLTNK